MTDEIRPGIILKGGSGDYKADLGGLVVEHLPVHEKHDLSTQIKEMGQRTRRRRERGGARLVLDVLKDESLITLAAGIESQTDRLIREAEELMAKDKYEEALQKLNSALAGSPNDSIALLLKGECLVSLEGMALLGLETTEPLLGVDLPPRLERRLKRVQADLREALIPDMYQEFDQTLNDSGPTTAALQMEKYRKAAPDLEDVYFLSAGGSMMADAFDEAEAKVAQGRRECAGKNCPQLDLVEESIAEGRLMSAMDDALQMLKDGSPAEAVAALDRCSRAGSGNDLYSDLLAYARSIKRANGLKGRNHVPSKIKAKRKDDLCHFIIHHELVVAQALLLDESDAEAEAVLAEALKYAPLSTTANFLMAHTIFIGIVHGSKRSGGLERRHIMKRLSVAERHVKKALPNSELDAAPHLKEQIDRSIEQLKELERVEPLFDEFKRTFEHLKAKGGFSSVQEAHDVKTRFADLAVRVAQARKDAPSMSDELGALETALRDILRQFPI